MKRAHILDADGVVTNSISLADESDPSEFGAVYGPDDVSIGWRLHDGGWAPPPRPERSLDDLRAAKVVDINTAAEMLFAVGAPVSGGLHVALDGNSRSDLTSMALAANTVLSGAAEWVATFPNYAKGWIAIENTRIPLPTASDGWMLALSVGSYYAALVQHRRDLKDAALAAADVAALEAIDISAGWPE